MSDIKNPIVLVVDDDRNDCDILSAALQDRGCSPVVALNGREALDYLRSAGGVPRLILLDLMMPEMNGWKFREIQKGDPALAAIPVAIITGMPGIEGKISGLGAVDVLYKPSRVEDIGTLVKRFCC